MDGFTQKAYEQYRINGDVTRVKDGLRLLMDYKRAGNHMRPRVNVFTMTLRQVVPEMDQIRAFWTEIGVDQLTFRPDESNLDGSYEHKTTVQPIGKCFWPWLTLSVDVDGSVYPCPVAFARPDRKAYGNANDL